MEEKECWRGWFPILNRVAGPGLTEQVGCEQRCLCKGGELQAEETARTEVLWYEGAWQVQGPEEGWCGWSSSRGAEGEDGIGEAKPGRVGTSHIGSYRPF